MKLMNKSSNFKIQIFLEDSLNQIRMRKTVIPNFLGIHGSMGSPVLKFWRNGSSP